MRFIDEKFKDNDPVTTVEHLRDILAELGIEVEERWNDSGIDNCHSLNLHLRDGISISNGKGVSREFARASAYAECIERLQSGLFLEGYQSLIRDGEMNLQTFAPDARYMSSAELVAESEWMDHLIDAYPEYSLTREMLAERCQIYSCVDDDSILCIPFYSLFEDKYVYLPAAFVNRMYSANGNCAGNTKEEAWVHALSEMMERYACQKKLISGTAAPQIEESVLQQFPTVSAILKQLREEGNLDVAIFDYSIGNGFPVVSTRVINKNDHSYHVNVAADPVLEIALQRTLTEMFQGRHINDLKASHNSKILRKVTDFPIINNVLNQLRDGNGLYTADYFAGELTCDTPATQFADNSGKTNKELLNYMLSLYRDLGRPVYVRNFSFLGFHSYKFVVPGFSETRAVRLAEVIPEQVLGDSAREVFKNAPAATDAELDWMLGFINVIKNNFARTDAFDINAGIPMVGSNRPLLARLTRAYACYRRGRFAEVISILGPLQRWHSVDEQSKQYCACISKYLEMKNDGIDEDKIRVILYKFFESAYPDKLYARLDKGLTPFDGDLLSCTLSDCESCRYHQDCRYHECRALVRTLGKRYQDFADGQHPDNFLVEL